MMTMIGAAAEEEEEQQQQTSSVIPSCGHQEKSEDQGCHFHDKDDDDDDDDHNNNNNIDNDDDDDELSYNTQDALLEMLGLSNLVVADDVEDGDYDDGAAQTTTTPTTVAAVTVTPESEHVAVINKKQATTMMTDKINSLTMEKDEESNNNPHPQAVLPCYPIQLPRKCSRYGHAPSQCAAVLVPQFLSLSECQALLERANRLPPRSGSSGSGSDGGYQYITEALHTAPDGTTYPVQLQHPNPHKLAVFEHAPTVDILWKRLLDQVQLNQCIWFQQFQRRTNCGPPTGLNPRLRIVKYDAHDNDRFEPHFDATTRVVVGGLQQQQQQQQQQHTSLITVLLYLNNGGGGGGSSSHITTTTTNHNKESENGESEFGGGETLFLDAHTFDLKKDTTLSRCGVRTKTTQLSPSSLLCHGSTIDPPPVDSKKNYSNGAACGRVNGNDEDTEDKETSSSSSSSMTKKIINPQAGCMVLFEHDLYHAGAPLQWGTKYVLRTDILFQTPPAAPANNKESRENNKDAAAATAKMEEPKNYTARQDELEPKTSLATNNTTTPAATAHNAAVTSSSPSSSSLPLSVRTCSTVQDLCMLLPLLQKNKNEEEEMWSDVDTAVLKDMGLWDMTIEAFLGPGPPLLRILLHEGGIDSIKRIDSFLQHAAEMQEVVRRSNE